MDSTPLTACAVSAASTLRGEAGEGTRTLDIQLGRLTLYQLSYTRLGKA